jgi:heat shock protein HslJ
MKEAKNIENLMHAGLTLFILMPTLMGGVSRSTPIHLPSGSIDLTANGFTTMIEIRNTKWQLMRVLMNGRVVSPPKLSDQVAISFDNQGQRAVGSGGCNSFGSQVRPPGGAGPLFVDLVATQMACSGEVMAFESLVFDALGKATLLKQIGPDRLWIANQDESVQLDFSRLTKI